MNWKKLGTALLAGVMAATLLAGCDKGGSGTGDPGQSTGSPSAQAPAPPQRSIEGVEFKFGDKKGKIYTLKAPQKAGHKYFNDPVFMQDAIYLHVDTDKDSDDSKSCLMRIAMKDDKLASLEKIAESRGVGRLATNGKAVFFASDRPGEKGKGLAYDGKALTVLDKDWFESTVGITGSEELLNVSGLDYDVRIATRSGDKMDYKDSFKLPTDKGQGYVPIYADKEACYFAVRYEDKNALLVTDTTGHEVRTITGWKDDEFGSWAVTQNYIVMFGKSEYNEKLDKENVCNFRIFDRASGKEIGDATVANFDPGHAVLMSGNSLLAFDGNENFYIIDL
jgi:hypothetical protein